MTEAISTRNVWPNYHQSNVERAASDKNDIMGKDQFLRIFLTQLRHQDPLQPLENKDLIAQMAQFTSVEQLMAMSQELSLIRQDIGGASQMIGKHILWDEQTDSGEVIGHEGIVKTVYTYEGKLYASTGEHSVAVADIIAVSNEPIGTIAPDQSEGESSNPATGEGEDVNG